MADEATGFEHETLSPSERDELENLRREKNQRAEAAAAAAVAEDAPPEPDFWLTLANGEVVETVGHMTHYKGVPVIAAHRITKKEA